MNVLQVALQALKVVEWPFNPPPTVDYFEQFCAIWYLL